MAQLAIRGHATRGKEVIQLLEMLGCKNKTDSDGLKWFNGTNVDSYYTIEGDNYIHMRLNSRKGDYIKFPLEEFLEKYPYKVGDKAILANEGIVTITNMYWDNVSNQVIYEGESNAREYDSMNASNLQPYTGQEEESMEEKKTIQVYKAEVISFADAQNKEYELDFADKFEIVLKEGKYFAVRKQLQYPKTYEECLNVEGIETISLELINNFRKLIIARNTYWKISGDWKPDWESNDKKYTITTIRNNICTAINWEHNTFLAFPTSEMRDAFYENFKELIEECKELL